MLLVLGGLSFRVWPFNATGTGGDLGGDYVEKPVMGRRPTLEFVGEASGTFTITAKLFPRHVGGLGDLERLHAIRRSGSPQYLMRGDGVPIGWVVVERVSEQHDHLTATGVGQEVAVEITLKHADAPQAASYFTSIMGLLE